MEFANSIRTFLETETQLKSLSEKGLLHMGVGKAPLCNVITAAAIVAVGVFTNHRSAIGTGNGMGWGGDGKPTKQNHDYERNASHGDLRRNQISHRHRKRLQHQPMPL